MLTFLFFSFFFKLFEFEVTKKESRRPERKLMMKRNGEGRTKRIFEGEDQSWNLFPAGLVDFWDAEACSFFLFNYFLWST